MKQSFVPIALGAFLILLLGACATSIPDQEATAVTVQEGLPPVTVYKSPT